MTDEKTDVFSHLADRSPEITGAEIAAHLVPPLQFQNARFDTYRPDHDYPSQAEAVSVLRRFATTVSGHKPSGLRSLWRKPEPMKPGVYLDGGFGVGKTHLLAALWFASSGRKYYGTFIEYTALVGALGYAAAVDLLRGADLICIDEFELDDPGDTMMMTRLLGELTATGSHVAATSNTPPNALGEGRFAAADFLREIQSMAGTFQIVRIDGLDYRRRDVTGSATVVSESDYKETLEGLVPNPSQATDDSFAEIIDHLGTLHPSRYVKLLDGIGALGIRDVSVVHDQTAALRLVAFIDRVYDAQIPIVQTGIPLSAVFDDDMLAGGYRKKYLRASSRLIALTSAHERL